MEMLRLNNETTDANAAIFDAANGFAGCTAGIHEVLRRQGLFEGIWCLDPRGYARPTPGRGDRPRMAGLSASARRRMNPANFGRS